MLTLERPLNHVGRYYDQICATLCGLYHVKVMLMLELPAEEE
jgi:heme/copper-type cytochrome/quinol oxidase subunit 2